MYQHFGIMLDCSRNAVMKVFQVKKFMDCMEKMGYNTLELYAEDTYRLPDEPYFGYLRGGYTAAELKDLDIYARAHGIELIPCVQALAHFTNLVKLPAYADMVDTADILMVDDARTYALIEKIIANAAENFTSRNLNIGMDEAHMVGLGRYLDKHGYQNRFEILIRHLRKVADIAQKYGFTVHMWSDMFFKLQTGGTYYCRDIHIDPAIRKQIPENVELTYWDYWNKDAADYDAMLASHLEFDRGVWFAGGAWSWNGFAPYNLLSMVTMKAAMESVRKNGISNVLITMWGDDGKECSFYALLPALYAIRQYADGNFDDEKIKTGFKALFGYEWEDFMLLDLPSHTKGVATGREIENPCKSLLYNDYFLGILDVNLSCEGHIPYEAFAQKLEEKASQMGELSYLFDFEAKLCQVLAIKAELGIKTRRAYKAGDRTALEALLQEYAQLPRRIVEFYEVFRDLWHKENKPFGFEVHDARLGGLILRTEACQKRIRQYLAGEIEVIDELEEEILPYGAQMLQMANYRSLVSVSNS